LNQEFSYIKYFEKDFTQRVCYTMTFDKFEHVCYDKDLRTDSCDGVKMKHYNPLFVRARFCKIGQYNLTNCIDRWIDRKREWFNGNTWGKDKYLTLSYELLSQLVTPMNFNFSLTNEQVFARLNAHCKSLMTINVDKYRFSCLTQMNTVIAAWYIYCSYKYSVRKLDFPKTSVIEPCCTVTGLAMLSSHDYQKLKRKSNIAFYDRISVQVNSVGRLLVFLWVRMCMELSPFMQTPWTLVQHLLGYSKERLQKSLHWIKMFFYGFGSSSRNGSRTILRPCNAV